MQTPHTSAAALLVHLLQETIDPIQSTAHLASLKPELLDYLHIKAIDLHCHAVSEARDLLDVALESLEHPLPTEHQRRLIERADDELASAQRWGELAVNARFCREHPELARQLAGDLGAKTDESDSAARTDASSNVRGKQLRKRRTTAAAPRRSGKRGNVESHAAVPVTL